MMQDYFLQLMGIERWLLRPSGRAIKKATHASSLMVVGDPLQGDLLEGQVGVLFHAMLKSIGLTLEQVYVTMEGELLQHEMLRVKPRVILMCVLGTRKESLNEIDDHMDSCVISYHPAYLLNHPLDKKQAYQDLLRVQQLLLVAV